MKRAFTIVEVVVVIAIVLVLAAIAFSVMGPSRESARQTVCVSQLKQWYQAMVLYSTDNEGPEQLPGLGSMQLIPAKGLGANMYTYLKDRRIWYCPDATEAIRREFLLTYHVRLRWGFEAGRLPAGFRAGHPGAAFVKDLATHGQLTPIIICTIHDEIYYQPREPDADPALTRPFEIHVLLNGSVKKGRIGTTRRRTYSRD